MTNPEFSRISEAIKWTLAYYTIDRIEPHIKHFAGTPMSGPNYSFWQDWIETTIGLHRRMENEINQTILHSNQFMNVYMFEALKELMKDERLASVNKQLLLKTIHDYNSNTYKKFEEEVHEKVREFQNHPNFQHNHLEEIEEEYFTFSNGLFPTGRAKRKVIKYKFYTIEGIQNYIDPQYLDQYCEVVYTVVRSFKNAVEKYIDMYEAKRMVFWDNLHPQEKMLIEDRPQKMLMESEKERWKLRLNISVPQIVCLFQALRERGLINNESNADLCRFIAANFSSKMAIDIGERSLTNSFGGTEKPAKDFWLEEIKQLRIIFGNL